MVEPNNKSVVAQWDAKAQKEADREAEKREKACKFNQLRLQFVCQSWVGFEACADGAIAAFVINLDV